MVPPSNVKWIPLWPSHDCEPQTLRFHSYMFNNSAAGIPKQSEVMPGPRPEVLNHEANWGLPMMVAMAPVWDRGNPGQPQNTVTPGVSQLRRGERVGITVACLRLIPNRKALWEALPVFGIWPKLHRKLLPPLHLWSPACDELSSQSHHYHHHH